ncbi:MAG: glycosyltransferase family 4 protein [Sandarakinorhabdus sp.]|nr:glycosyltransferase family 4 protein [Sandarakinorhabdus sp.]
MIKVLYLHPFGVNGGATKSLSEVFAAMQKCEIEGAVIAPAGVASTSLTSVGLRVLPVKGLAQWDDTRFGHYRGFRWLILLRELAYWPSSVVALRKAARQGPFDLIHCNEITALLVGLLAKRMLSIPLLVHVRSLQRDACEGSKVTAWLQGLLRRHADAIVAIDESVRRTLPTDLPVHIIHNGMRVPLKPYHRSINNSELFRVGIIGVLHRSKGIYELLAAVKLLHTRGVPIKLIIAGVNGRSLKGISGWLLKKLDFAQDVHADLKNYVSSNGLSHIVEFVGFVRDVDSLYHRIDAVCFPSHLDAPGRPVFEAALNGLPSIVAMKNPTNDVIIQGVTGICIDKPDPKLIANAIQDLSSNRKMAYEMGLKAQEIALSKFDSQISAEKMIELYKKVKLGNRFQ